MGKRFRAPEPRGSCGSHLVASEVESSCFHSKGTTQSVVLGSAAVCLLRWLERRNCGPTTHLLLLFSCQVSYLTLCDPTEYTPPGSCPWYFSGGNIEQLPFSFQVLPHPGMEPVSPAAGRFSPATLGSLTHLPYRICFLSRVYNYRSLKSNLSPLHVYMDIIRHRVNSAYMHSLNMVLTTWWDSDARTWRV